MKKIKNLHPGLILQEELLEPLGITLELLADSIHVPVSTVSNVVKGKEPITPDLAIRLSRFFGFSRNFWSNLQQDYEMREQERKKAKVYRLIQRYKRVTKRLARTRVKSARG